MRTVTGEFYFLLLVALRKDSQLISCVATHALQVAKLNIIPLSSVNIGNQ